MAVTANIVLSGSIVGSAVANKQLGPLTLNSAAASELMQTIQTTTAGVGLGIPTSGNPATGVIINLPAGNANQVILKGVTGDTGVTFGPTGFICLSWPTGSVPSAIYLTAITATISGIQIFWF